MGHGPCGHLYAHLNSPCMAEGKCTVKYPRDYAETTTMGNNAYPVYRRRDNGRTMWVKRNNMMIEVDNRWVVPYNPALSLMYNCHINVEICHGIRCIKYLYKYAAQT